MQGPTPAPAPQPAGTTPAHRPVPPAYATQPPPGKPRSPGIDILLFIVTLGVYWFVWLYKAFDEVARTRGRDLQAGMWVGILAAIWIVNLGVGAAGGAQAALEAFREAGTEPSPDEEAPSFDEIFQPEFTAFVVAGMALSAIFYVVQLIYLRNANQVVNEILQSSGLRPGPNPGMAVAFCVLYIAGQIPIIGVFAGLAGLVVAIIWIVQIQNAINTYWQGPPRAAPPYPGPPPAPAPQAYGGAPPPPQP